MLFGLSPRLYVDCHHLRTFVFRCCGYVAVKLSVVFLQVIFVAPKDIAQAKHGYKPPLTLVFDLANARFGLGPRLYVGGACASDAG